MSSSRNAVRHGLSAASVVVIDGIEDEAKYRCLLSAVIADLDAVGPVETLLAERIAQIFWRLRRVLRFETESLSQRQSPIAAARCGSTNMHLLAESDRTIRALD